MKYLRKFNESSFTDVDILETCREILYPLTEIIIIFAICHR